MISIPPYYLIHNYKVQVYNIFVFFVYLFFNNSKSYISRQDFIDVL